MTTPPFKQLENDARREAVDSLRGYSYQVLRSIEVWIDLGDEEQLVLEGAEDLDRISAGAAIVEQVKDTVGSGGITLRTPAVLDAIGHAWEHANANPGVTLSFRYLTTSPIGREKGEGLGIDGAGIAAWQSIRSDPASEASHENAVKISTFLCAHERLDKGLRAFLGSTATDKIIEQIILPVDFITGQGNIDALRERIERKLIAIGSARGDSVDDSRKALGALHLEAWKRTVSRDRKPLTRADFLIAFEGATRTAVPNSQLMTLMSALLGSGGERQIALAGARPLVERVPPLPPRYYRRRVLEADLATRLQKGSVAIQGGTGMGKTSLVAAMVANLPTAIWLSLRDAGPAIVNARLAEAEAQVVTRPSCLVVILDDLDPGYDPRMIEACLASLRATVNAVDGRILVTSAQELPPRLTGALGIEAGGGLRMPSFLRAEIEEYLTEQSCPQGLVKTWAGLIELGTSGHPQLVHARINDLRLDGFRKPGQADLIETPQAVLDVRAEARRLVGLLPADVRELLLRASLELGKLTRNELIRIARIDKPIDEPGIVLDALIGPWLEYADNGTYRVSPLVRDAGTALRGPEWTRSMHLALAWVLLENRTLDPSSLSTLLMHVTIARNPQPLIRLIPSLIGLDGEIWSQIADVCGFYLYVGTGSAKGPAFDDPADNLIFRIFQLWIAAPKGGEARDDIVRRCDEEWVKIEDRQDGRAAMFRLLFLSQLLSKASDDLPLAKILDYGLELAALGREMSTIQADRSRSTEEPVATGEPSDLASFMSLPLTRACKRHEDLSYLLDRIEASSQEDALRILRAYGEEPVGAGLNTDRLWLAELQTERKDWAGLSSALERAFNKAIELKVAPLAEAIAPLLVRIADEDMSDPAETFSRDERLRPRLTETAPLDCAVAKVHWRAGELQAALDLYEKALPLWKSGRENLDLASAYRDAGIAAARADKWRLAADRFATGSLLLPQSRMVGRRIGFLFDQGHALSMAGDELGALETLTRAVSELEPLEPVSNTEPILSAQKRAGAVLQMLIEFKSGTKTREEAANYAGVCSIIDPLVMDSMTPLATDFIVFNLLRLEELTPGSTTVAKRYAARIRATPNLIIKGVLPNLLVRAMESDGDYAPLVSDLVWQVRSFVVARQHQADGTELSQTFDPTAPFLPFPDAFGMAMVGVAGAVFKMAAAGTVDTAALAQWASDVPVDDGWAPLRQLVEEAHRLFTTNEDLWPSVVKPRAGEFGHMLAALAAVTRTGRAPEELLICHAIWAHYATPPVQRSLLEVSIETLVTRQWLAMCDNPSVLVTPRITVPAIRAAAAHRNGWARVRAILTAAMGAVERNAANNARVVIDAMENPE